ncbi:hypothetical protein CROQUDRAFT_337666 [Cronartium quercuum f. sp. fusiforme G11]|uniref:Uncharacterized protein n=1 Tax=Cronartium quercuum f. sp. fusiforme G11 TaxID=708437 RepID=A0A9P6NAF4_9BASI|nr:hypothetical protein CROQUDRAFT_337666 [Cronartium quercuum f. sp. fusiforme G11]
MYQSIRVNGCSHTILAREGAHTGLLHSGPLQCISLSVSTSHTILNRERAHKGLLHPKTCSSRSYTQVLFEFLHAFELEITLI